MLSPSIQPGRKPTPQNATNTFYDQDGYSGGSYVNCQNISQPGILAVTNYLPPVSIVKPSGFNDDYPASSKLDLFEGFVKKIVNQVEANPSLWDDTASMKAADTMTPVTSSLSTSLEMEPDADKSNELFHQLMSLLATLSVKYAQQSHVESHSAPASQSS